MRSHHFEFSGVSKLLVALPSILGQQHTYVSRKVTKYFSRYTQVQLEHWLLVSLKEDRTAGSNYSVLNGNLRVKPIRGRQPVDRQVCVKGEIPGDRFALHSTNSQSQELAIVPIAKKLPDELNFISNVRTR